MDRRKALAILGLGAAACGPRPVRSGAPSPGPTDQHHGGVPARPVGPAPEPAAPGPDLDVWRRRLAEARRAQIERLAEYSRGATFPTYRDPGGEARIRHRILTDLEPVFIDESGVHCAVGYLMLRSGWGEAAREIARIDNHVRIEEVEGGPLLEWVRRSGLTQEEAARIQPSYHWEPEPRPEPRRIAIEIHRLQQHFAETEHSLRVNTESSLELALARL